MEVRVWWIGSVLVAAVLCLLPLTSLLGYESSAVMGVVLGLASMRITGIELDRSQGSVRSRGPTSPLLWWLDRLGPRLVLTLPAALVLGLNALRVRNCDPFAGVVFWALIPMVSVLVGHALVFVLGRATGSGRRGFSLALLVVAADTAWFVGRLVWEPPITGVHSLFGYFAGSIYDEALSIPRALLWYRLMLVLLAFGAVFAWELRHRIKAGARPITGAVWGTVLLLGAAGAIAAQADRFGFWLDRADIAERLGAEVSSEHFVVHYDPSAFDARQIAAMVDDHEYRYAELAAFFGEDPIQDAGRPLHSYVYPDRPTQHLLFGSRNTFVARPWTYEMHIRWDSTGDTAVAHELAHLFTAPFGGGPLSLATDGGVWVHLGLVEGIALAADWPPGELTPHEAAAAMRALDIAPNLRSLFEPSGFWSQPSGKAYTLMGSFVRWLVDTRGIDDFKRVYAHGDWQGVYGQSPDALVTEWEAFVDRLTIDPSRLEMARFRYSKRTIFKKVCARTIAELRRQARNAKGRGDFEGALDLQEQILGFQKGTPEPGLEIAHLLIRLQRYDDATALLDSLLAREGKRSLKPKVRAEVEEMRADILWRADRRAEAAEAYEGCLGWGLSDGERRRLALKLLGTTTDDATTSELAFQYLFESSGRPRQLWSAWSWLQHTPDDPMARYLMGFQLFQAGLADQAIPHLSGPPGTLAHVDLDEQRQLMLARALARVGRTDEAMAVWVRLFNATSSRVRLLAIEGADRLRFAQGQPLLRADQAP